ncbi:signal peptidase I [uncultured Eubacterium sp.]|uniref:signal peptidase I n=1 Tax=uncultured Eubacterium sp. TaxID=165185 RepID=UPI0015BB60CB|nr:signal peptidase I [uncultured Eubacterium sp.]
MSEEKNAPAVEPQEEQAKKSKLRDFLEFIAPIVIAMIIAMILKYCVFANAVIPTGSMLDTIQQGDRVIASRLAYTFGDPERFDIAIFKYPDNEKEYFVKRVIGLPGEKVDILNGTVYITGADGKTLELRDDFVSEENKDNYCGSFVVPEDCYFVMGDNRDNSVDSRYWVTTNYVSRDKFIGKVMFRYYPFKTAGKLE